MQILAIMVMVGIISCKEEDTKPTPEKLVPVTVEFGEDIIVLENNGLREIVLEFDNPSQGEGEISLSVQSATLDGIDISDMDDSGNIDLFVEKGAISTTITVEIIDNILADEERVYTIKIDKVSEAFEIGSKKVLSLKVIDDEMYGKLKSFSSTQGIVSNSRSIEYDEFGRIYKVNWENKSIHYQSGTDTYLYENGQLSAIHYNEMLYENYFWDNNKVVKSERFQNGVKQTYYTYSYDEAGNIGEKLTYTLQQDGSYKVAVVFNYSYNADGNIKKIITYVPEGDGFKWISTRTYGDYINKPNSYPYEVVSTVRAQNKLPGFLKVETETTNTQSTYTYEFDDKGHPAMRVTSETGEIAEYQHY